MEVDLKFTQSMVDPYCSLRSFALSIMFFHPFTKLLLYRYNETLRLDLTGLAEWKLLASQCDMDDENMPGMVQWQLDVRALLRKQVIDELEAEVNK